MLPRFFHRSKQEAKAVSAELQPMALPPRREIVTALRATVPATADLALAPPARSADERRLDGEQPVQPVEPPPRALGSRPGASAEEILEAGLDLVLAAHAKRKGLVAKPRKEPPPSKSDHIPAHVKRAVWIRDGGRCQFKLENGEICGSTMRLEFDHIQPRARGGPSTLEDVRVACRPHNGLAARRVFGNEWMDRFTRKKPIPRDQADAPRAT